MRRWIARVGTVGHLARMVVFGLVGIFLVKAAVDYAPSAAVGLDGALAKLLHQSYGSYLLGIVAAGLDRVRALLAERRALPPNLRFFSTGLLERRLAVRHALERVEHSRDLECLLDDGGGVELKAEARAAISREPVGARGRLLMSDESMNSVSLRSTTTRSFSSTSPVSRARMAKSSRHDLD